MKINTAPYFASLQQLASYLRLMLAAISTGWQVEHTLEGHHNFREGTWMPVDGSGANLQLTTGDSKWVRMGQLVFISAAVAYPVTADASAASLDGLPWTVDRVSPATVANNADGVYGGVPSVSNIAPLIAIRFVSATRKVRFNDATTGGNKTNANFSGLLFHFSLTYRTSDN